MDDHNKLVAALKEVIYDSDPDGIVLVKRIPLICNDIRWIKRAMFGLYGLIGAVLLALIVKSLGS